MKLSAKKPCSFGGQKFFIGDDIPVELVANPFAQEKMGVIAITGEEAYQEEAFCPVEQTGVVMLQIPIHAEEGDLILNVTAEELIVFTDILQLPVAKAEYKQQISEMIQKIESEDLLILLDALDGRKHVKEEAQARAQALNSLEGDL